MWNVLADEAINILRRKFTPRRLSDEVPNYLRIIYFSWRNEFYEQKEGAATVSPLLTIDANLYMEFSEEEILNISPLALKCWL